MKLVFFHCHGVMYKNMVVMRYQHKFTPWRHEIYGLITKFNSAENHDMVQYLGNNFQTAGTLHVHNTQSVRITITPNSRSCELVVLINNLNILLVRH